MWGTALKALGSMFGGSGGGGGMMSGLMGGGGSGGGGGGLMGGGGGGKNAPPAEGMQMLSQGMQAAQAPNMSQGQIDPSLGMTEQSEKEEIDWAGMGNEDFEKKFLMGEIDLEDPLQKERMISYAMADESPKDTLMDNRQSQLGTGGPHGQAQATQLGMSGMGMSQPQGIPQIPGMGGLMGMSTRGIQRVPYRSRSGLMG